MSGRWPKTAKAQVRRWVKALRSGDYQQGRDQLRSESPDHGARFCCLGVLVDLAGGDLGGGGVYIRDDLGKGLAPELIDWLGIPGEASQQDRLSTLNDEGHTFEQIADDISSSWGLK